MPMKPNHGSNATRALRWAAAGVLGCLSMSLAGGCSSPPLDCNPPIPAGAKYRVTVLGETPESHKCHIVTLRNTFEITAAHDDPTAMHSSCNMTPANWAPDATGIQVIRCSPSASAMLGTNCEMQYPSRCAGQIEFYFYAPVGTAVNWSAPRIEGARFRIQDYASECLPAPANCLDEYNVLLERTL
jgi:hypothetical protein